MINYRGGIRRFWDREGARRNWDREQHGSSTEEGTFPGCTIVGDDLQFLMALDRYKRRESRPFMTWLEVLAVAHALGWRKVAEATDLPRCPKE